MSKTTVIIRGDETANQIHVIAGIMAQQSLKDAFEWLYPMTQKQVKAALDVIPDDLNKKLKYDWIDNEVSQQIVAALIVAESDLFKMGDFEVLREKVCEALNECGYRLMESQPHEWVCPDFYCYWIDSTDNWNIPDEWQDKIERIESVRYFDKNSVCYACEMTPSFLVYELEDRVVMKPGFEDEREACEEALDLFQQTQDDHYIHCRSLEQLMESHPERFYRYGNPAVNIDEVSDGYDGICYDVREGFHSNGGYV